MCFTCFDMVKHESVTKMSLSGALSERELTIIYWKVNSLYSHSYINQKINVFCSYEPALFIDGFSSSISTICGDEKKILQTIRYRVIHTPATIHKINMVLLLLLVLPRAIYYNIDERFLYKLQIFVILYGAAQVRLGKCQRKSPYIIVQKLFTLL